MNRLERWKWPLRTAALALVASQALSSCTSKAAPEIEDCYQSSMRGDPSDVRSNLELDLEENPNIVDDDLSDTKGIHGVGAASHKIEARLRELREKETNRDTIYGVSAGDKYGYCVEKDGTVTIGRKKHFKITEER